MTMRVRSITRRPVRCLALPVAVRPTERGHGNAPGGRAAITILELLIVISSLAALAALLLPAVHTARESARNLECTNNLRQIGLALHEHHNAHRALPAGWKIEPSMRSAFGWATCILDDAEQRPVESLIARSRPLDQQSQWLRSTTPAMYLCPSDFGYPTFTMYAELGGHGENAQESTTILTSLPEANYVGVFGTTDPDDVPGPSGDGVFVERRERRFDEITRGLSHVLVVGERTKRKLPSTWLGFMVAGEDAEGRITGYADLGPNREDADECEFDSRHIGHVNFVCADGHVASIANDVDRKVYQDEAKYR